MSVRRLHAPFWLIGSLASLSGCGPGGSSVDYGAERHIVAQLCMPRETAAGTPSLTLDEITEHSIGGNTELPIGSTSAGQPVFKLLLHAPGDSRYVVVGKRDSELTVFIVLPEVPRDQWTPWRSADFASSQPELAFALLRDAELSGRVATPPAAPRIRYRLMTFTEYLGLAKAWHDKGLERDVPGC